MAPSGFLVLSYVWEENPGDQTEHAMGPLSTALVPSSSQLLWDGKWKKRNNVVSDILRSSVK